jgi:hypothetical protein
MNLFNQLASCISKYSWVLPVDRPESLPTTARLSLVPVLEKTYSDQ